MSEQQTEDPMLARFREAYNAALLAWCPSLTMTDGVNTTEREWNMPAEDLYGSLPDDWRMRFVEATAHTGSRYVVVATRLHHPASLTTGGNVLVSVLHPWSDTTVMQSDHGLFLHQNYVAEKLTDGRRDHRHLHGGDLAALTLTCRWALGRTVTQ